MRVAVVVVEIHRGQFGVEHLRSLRSVTLLCPLCFCRSSTMVMLVRLLAYLRVRLEVLVVETVLELSALVVLTGSFCV